MYNTRFIGRTKFENKSLHSEQQLGMSLIDLYEAWNKPEKAEEWLAKLPKTEDKIEWHNAFKMYQFTSVCAYNHPTTRKAVICQFP